MYFLCNASKAYFNHLMAPGMIHAVFEICTAQRMEQQMTFHFVTRCFSHERIFFHGYFVDISAWLESSSSYVVGASKKRWILFFEKKKWAVIYWNYSGFSRHKATVRRFEVFLRRWSIVAKIPYTFIISHILGSGWEYFVDEFSYNSVRRLFYFVFNFLLRLVNFFKSQVADSHLVVSNYSLLCSQCLAFVLYTSISTMDCCF